MNLAFSHETLRPGQDELVKTVKAAFLEKKHALIHAPTGLGKTAAVLAPALEHAIKNNLTIFFLTSRHTQHKIVLETVQKLKEKNKLPITLTSLIGKKHFCAQENVSTMNTSDFAHFCKSLVEENACAYYVNARSKNNLHVKKLLYDFALNPSPPEQVIRQATSHMLCPYEVSLMLAQESRIIIADYYYIFHPLIREALLGKISKELNKCILIIDEAHNLPSRMRDLLTTRLSSNTIRLGIQEAKKYSLDDALSLLVELQDILNSLSPKEGDKLILQEQFSKPLEKIEKYDEVIEILESAAEAVRKEQHNSHIGSIAQFISEWRGPDKCFARVISRSNLAVTLSNKCLDPALLTKEVFAECATAILMSATLQPLTMYADLLGLQGAMQKSFKSPFPEANRLALIVPKTTTKYSLRNEEQYKEIAEICAEIAETIPGCVMIFFPSYSVRDNVAGYFAEIYKSRIFYERAGMTKEEKQKLLDNFAKCTSAVLLGVASGSFGEGVDLPGVLKGVIIAGLPLDKPDLETTQLIKYYDEKFGKGWEYGYIMPAMNKCIQNAGRCIRTEKDRGTLIFLDERYSWPRYSSSFPSDWNTRITFNYREEIARFFGKLF